MWCVDPSSWVTKPFDGERLSEIKSALQSSLEDANVRAAAVAVLNGALPLSTVTKRSQVEQLLGKAYCEFALRGERLSDSKRLTESVRASVAELDQRLEGMMAILEIPREVCVRNVVISPTLLDELWKRFQNGLSAEMIPIDPFRDRA